MPRGASARLFAALDPPPEVAQELARWARAALRSGGERGPRVLAPESLHVTLMFLGERPFEEIGDLSEALSAAAERAPALALRPGAPVWLPPRRPRALAVEIGEDTGELGVFQRELARRLCAVAGLPVPGRFRAHLTIARARSGAGPQRELPPTPALGFTAEEVVLYRSRLEPGGARYERVAGAPLMG
jgi:RNA 2',3'-cyclic 3'-phosphodiesterase